MLKIYFTGIFILIAAIIFNMLAGRTGFMSWYEFLSKLSAEGRSAFSQVRWLDYLWLFILYPFLLGLSGWGANKIFEMLFK